MQNTYNVTMRSVRATIVAVEKQYALHSLSVFVAFGIHNAMQMRRIIICSLSCCTVFFYIISLTARFTKKSYWTWIVCFDFLYNFCLKHFSF